MSSIEEHEQQMIADEQVHAGKIEFRAIDSFEKALDVEKPVLWKLVMLRKINTITVRFCDWCDCQRDLYQDKDKSTLHEDGSVTMRIKLCSECVDLNIKANEAAAKFYRAKKKKESSDDRKTELAKLKDEVRNSKKEHWKLLMIRRVASVQIRISDFCGVCSRHLFDNKQKFIEHEDGSTTVVISLCPICKVHNIEANEAAGAFYRSTTGSLKRK